MNQCLVNYCQVNFFHRKKAMHNSPPCSGTGGLKNATGCSGNGSDITAGGLQKHPILLRGGITPTSDTPHPKMIKGPPAIGIIATRGRQ